MEKKEVATGEKVVKYAAAAIGTVGTVAGVLAYDLAVGFVCKFFGSGGPPPSSKNLNKMTKEIWDWAKNDDKHLI